MEPVEKTDRKNISSIETFFDSLLRGKDKLTENLYFGELPVELKKDWKDIVVVDCGNPLRDENAYAAGTVIILLYVKQNPYGTKDVKRMQELEKALNRLVRENDDPYYHLSFRGRYTNYNAVNDIFMNVVQLNLVIT